MFLLAERGTGSRSSRSSRSSVQRPARKATPSQAMLPCAPEHRLQQPHQVRLAGGDGLLPLQQRCSGLDQQLAVFACSGREGGPGVSLCRRIP